MLDIHTGHFLVFSKIRGIISAASRLEDAMTLAEEAINRDVDTADLKDKLLICKCFDVAEIQPARLTLRPVTSNYVSKAVTATHAEPIKNEVTTSVEKFLEGRPERLTETQEDVARPESSRIRRSLSELEDANSKARGEILDMIRKDGSIVLKDTYTIIKKYKFQNTAYGAALLAFSEEMNSLPEKKPDMDVEQAPITMSELMPENPTVEPPVVELRRVETDKWDSTPVVDDDALEAECLRNAELEQSLHADDADIFGN